MKTIIIKGDFTIESDLPSLDKMVKRSKLCVIKLREPPPIAFIEQFKGIEEDTSSTQDAPKKYLSTNLAEDGREYKEPIICECGHPHKVKDYFQEKCVEMGCKCEKFQEDTKSELERLRENPEYLKHEKEYEEIADEFQEDTKSELCVCGHIKFEHEEKGKPTRCMYANGRGCVCQNFTPQDKSVNVEDMRFYKKGKKIYEKQSGNEPNKEKKK